MLITYFYTKLQGISNIRLNYNWHIMVQWLIDYIHIFLLYPQLVTCLIGLRKCKHYNKIIFYIRGYQVY